MPVASRRTDYLFFCLTWLQIRVPTTSSSGSAICYNSSQNLGKYCIFLSCSLFQMNSEPDEEVQRTRSGSIPSTEASVTVELECTAFLAYGCGHQPEALGTPSFGIFTEVPLWRHGWLNHWPPSSLSPPKGRKLFHSSSYFISLCGSDWRISFDLSLGVLTFPLSSLFFCWTPSANFYFHCCFSLVNFWFGSSFYLFVCWSFLSFPSSPEYLLLFDEAFLS